MEMKNQFLNRKITIKKTDNSWIKGKCIDENISGLTIFIEDSRRTVFISSHQISEIILDDRVV